MSTHPGTANPTAAAGQRWGIDPRDSGPVLTLKTMWKDRRARRWMTGALFAAIGFGGTTLWSAYAAEKAPAFLALLTVSVAGLCLAFLLVPALSFGRPVWARLLGLLAVIVPCIPIIATSGPTSGYILTFVSATVGTQQYSRKLSLVLLGAVTLAALLVGSRDGAGALGGVAEAAVVGALGMMMLAFRRNLLTLNELRSTQQELAIVAVAEERNRLARDMHDILGHSLTVMTVKTELAKKLLDAGQTDRARTELEELEALSRSALADVRKTVRGVREMSVAAEVLEAKSVLDAAGISGELPTHVDEVPLKYQALFGFVVREGVTNIVRHSGARAARIRVGKNFVSVEDDGAGLSANAAGSGQGLDGLRERVAEFGGMVSLGASPLGGVQVKVEVP